MSNPNPTIKEQIKALAFLRGYAKDPGFDIVPTDAELALAKAINILDNGGVFAALDEARDEREAAGSNFCNCSEPGAPPCIIKGHPLDPAERGDTTHEDMARHQQS